MAGCSSFNFRNTVLPDISFEDEKDKYMDKLSEVLHCYNGRLAAKGPGKLLDHLYLGNLNDALDVKLLKRLKITHVINCCALKDYSMDLQCQENPYDPKTGVTNYIEFEALDNPSYPMLWHYDKAESFINQALEAGGRVLVHCELGVNRSGALCVAYLMVHENMTLLEAVKSVKAQRSVLLTNQGFVKQLYYFAKERKLLFNNQNK